MRLCLSRHQLIPSQLATTINVRTSVFVPGFARCLGGALTGAFASDRKVTLGKNGSGAVAGPAASGFGISLDRSETLEINEPCLRA